MSSNPPLQQTKFLIKKILQTINTFFANIGPDLSRKIPQHQDKYMEQDTMKNNQKMKCKT